MSWRDALGYTFAPGIYQGGGGGGSPRYPTEPSAYKYKDRPEDLADLKSWDRKKFIQMELLQQAGMSTDKAAAKLERRGFTAEEIAALRAQVSEGDVEERLRRMSSTGAEGAATAEYRMAQMMSGKAETQLRDAYALDAEKLRQQLQASSYGPVDPNSPAFQATLAQFSQGGADELSRRLMQMDQVNLQNLTQAAAQIGSIVEMQRMAREQESLANAVSMGQVAGLLGGIAGTLIGGPIGGMAGAAFGAGVGGAFGGTQGGAAGLQGGLSGLGLGTQMQYLRSLQGSTMVPPTSNWDTAAARGGPTLPFNTGY